MQVCRLACLEPIKSRQTRVLANGTHYGDRRLIDRQSQFVADSLVTEEVPNDSRASLGGSEVGTDPLDHSELSRRATSTEPFRLDGVVERAVGIEVGRARRREEGPDFLPAALEPRSCRSGFVRGLAVEDQEDLPSGVSNQAPKEADEGGRAEVL